MNRTLIVIDCDNLAWRSHHVLSRLRFGGMSTGATFGFLTEMLRASERFNSDRFAFCFDIGQSKRIDIYPGYKDNYIRKCNPDDYKTVKNQLKRLREEFLPCVGYQNIFCQDGYEADDLIASVCKNTDMNVVIISSDKDLYQLISPNVSISISAAQASKFGHAREISLQVFHQKYKIDPADWIMVKAIAGCRGDLVKGVRGVGELSAVKYVAGELKDGSRYKTLIENGKETIKRNLNLVTLPYPGVMNCCVVDDEVIRHKWNLLVNRYGMDTLVDKIPVPHNRLALFDG